MYEFPCEPRQSYMASSKVLLQINYSKHTECENPYPMHIFAYLYRIRTICVYFCHAANQFSICLNCADGGLNPMQHELFW